MAGHETILVRPKQFVQDPLKIAAGSPLAIQGVFLEIIRERFSVDAGLGLIWRPDLTSSDVLIETGYNEELEARNQVPAIYVNRLQTVPGKVMVGDRVGVRLPDHKEAFGALNTAVLSIECVSNDEGESAVLGDVIQYMILASQDVIQRAFGFYDISHPSLSATQPYDRDQTKWSTSVEFNVQFWIRWSQVPIAPLLQQIAQRITNKGVDANGHFVDITVNSLRRGEVFDPCDIAPGAPLPPSRVSIVGPAGPPGPAGNPGPAGPPGASFDLLTGQPVSGVINGINLVYTTASPFIHTLPKKEIFYVNGVRQNVGTGNDYTVSESVPLGGVDTLTMVYYAPKAGDVLTIDYYADI
jgi:hypothetical protein